MGVAFERVVDAFRQEGLIVEDRGRNQVSAQAPGHSAADRSVTITDTEGQCLIYSHSDPTEDVLERLGLTVKDLFDEERGVEYKYSDGRTVHRSTDKKFRQSGNTKGTALFHVEKLEPGRPVFLCEGEKDCLALEAVGHQAVTTAMGSGKAHMFDLTPLYGREVTIVRDKDEAGDKHAQQLYELLSPYCPSVKVVTALEGKDAADHIAAGHSVDEFVLDESSRHRAMLNDIWTDLQAAKDMSSEDAIRHLQRSVDRAAMSLVKDDEKPFKDWNESLDDWWEWMYRQDEHEVIPTPWDFMNASLAGGLHRGRSYIWAARPGRGKSIALINIARTAALVGMNVALFSLEMSNNEVMSRIIASGADAEYSQIIRKNIDDLNMNLIGEYLDRAAGNNIHISDRQGLTIEQIQAECRRLNDTVDGGIDLFVFDYMQLIKAKGSMKAHEMLEVVGQGIRRIAKECNAASVSAVQLNRDSVNEGRPPRVEDLRGSGAIEQDADVIALIHHDLDPNTNSPNGDAHFILGKNRTGAPSQHKLTYRPHRMMFS